MLKASTFEINELLTVNSEDYAALSNVEIEIEIRSCIIGEALTEDGQCVECTPIYEYLLILKEDQVTECLECNLAIA